MYQVPEVFRAVQAVEPSGFQPKRAPRRGARLPQDMRRRGQKLVVAEPRPEAGIGTAYIKRLAVADQHVGTDDAIRNHGVNYPRMGLKGKSLGWRTGAQFDRTGH
jgi:hypothetical protein